MFSFDRKLRNQRLPKTSAAAQETTATTTNTRNVRSDLKSASVRATVNEMALDTKKIAKFKKRDCGPPRSILSNSPSETSYILRLSNRARTMRGSMGD